ncbi:MAG: YihA family ribosome biogenesis GTP-binding protein [Solobacterium sp.]|nr:YihA family ribosome biogenesis GTP-binding protein [Solobacterium sp.]
MQYHDVTLLATAADRSQWPESSLPEIMFAGRSNAGKSTLINTLVNRKKLAYTGKTPGKTRLLNFFEIDGRYVFCDSPGYGYAVGGDSSAETFQKLIDPYMHERETLKGVVLVLDIRRTPNEDDLLMRDFARESGLKLLPVCMKADKLSRGAGIQAAAKIAKLLETSSDEICIVSGTEKTGIEQVWNQIETLAAE